jgi:myo-inositol-1(or 4)-monophosphatase
MVPCLSMDVAPARHPDLASLEQSAAEVVSRAAVVLRERFSAGVAADQVEFKDKQQRDPVTAIDRAVEALVRTELRSRFPTHGILGEEGTGEAVDSEYLWVLDPIDGTANFAAGLPFYGLSLGLLRNGAPIVGCLYVPFWPESPGGDVLRASLGNGARIGSREIRLERQPFRPGGPVAVPPGLRMMFALTGNLAKRSGEARNLGSIVAEIAMVATGGFQYAVFGGPKLWDVAAGAIIVKEAGGAALTWEGGRWRPIVQFRAPKNRPSKPKPDPKKSDQQKPEKPKTLRDWSQPVLVAIPGAAGHVGAGLAPRRPPPAALVWAYKQRRTVRDWWRKQRGKSTPPPPTPTPPSGALADALTAAPAGSTSPDAPGAPPAASA